MDTLPCVTALYCSLRNSWDVEAAVSKPTCLLLMANSFAALVRVSVIPALHCPPWLCIWHLECSVHVSSAGLGAGGARRR